MPRPNTGYLFQRPGSTNWYVEIQYPPALKRKRLRKSLGTCDKREAEALALPLIAEHKRLMVDEANRRRGLFRVREVEYEYALGDSTLDDGTQVRANDHFATLTAPDGSVTEVENGRFATIRMRSAPPDLSDPYALLKTPAPTKGVDKDIDHVERWIVHRNVTAYLQKEARESYRLFKELSGGKRFAAASRDDGRLLVQHLFAMGNKRATVAKKVGHLSASVNLAISEGKLRFNPFSDIIPRVNDAKKRLPVSDYDMGVIVTNLHTLKPEEKLLFLICAATGMRRGEAYSIAAERTVDGLRCVTVGTKTEQSLREIPLPAGLLPYLPALITGPLFTKDLKNLGRETLRSIRRLGIANPEACLHGLRHRAADRLKNIAKVDGHKCQDSMRHAILGHEDKSVAENYGTGYAMSEIRPWIDQIL